MAKFKPTINKESEILNLGAVIGNTSKLNKMETSELRKVVEKLSKVANSRIATLEKHASEKKSFSLYWMEQNRPSQVPGEYRLFSASKKYVDEEGVIQYAKSKKERRAYLLREYAQLTTFLGQQSSSWEGTQQVYSDIKLRSGQKNDEDVKTFWELYNKLENSQEFSNYDSTSLKNALISVYKSSQDDDVNTERTKYVLQGDYERSQQENNAQRKRLEDATFGKPKI